MDIFWMYCLRKMDICGGAQHATGNPQTFANVPQLAERASTTGSTTGRGCQDQIVSAEVSGASNGQM